MANSKPVHEATAATELEPWVLFQPLSTAKHALRMKLRGSIILCEGCIGVGKTTAVRRLAKYATEELHLHGVALLEDMPKPLLGYFKADPQHRAFVTQCIMLYKRGQAMAEAARLVRENPDAVVFMDRSLAGDMAFAFMHRKGGNISKEEFAIYQQCSETMCQQAHYETPLLTLHFQACDATLKERIQQRGYAEEIDYYLHTDPGYLDRLGDAYKAILKPEVVGCKVVPVPWEMTDRCFKLRSEDCTQLLANALDWLEDDPAYPVVPQPHPLDDAATEEDLSSSEEHYQEALQSDADELEQEEQHELARLKQLSLAALHDNLFAEERIYQTGLALKRFQERVSAEKVLSTADGEREAQNVRAAQWLLRHYDPSAHDLGQEEVERRAWETNEMEFAPPKPGEPERFMEPYKAPPDSPKK